MKSFLFLESLVYLLTFIAISLNDYTPQDISASLLDFPIPPTLGGIHQSSSGLTGTIEPSVPLALDNAELEYFLPAEKL